MQQPLSVLSFVMQILLNSVTAPEDTLPGNKARFGHLNSPMGWCMTALEGSLFMLMVSVTKGSIEPR